MPAQEDAAPFFIVGSARSGTTLMRMMLNAHSQLAVPPESRFITELWDGQEEVAVDEFLARLDAHARFAAWELPIEAVRSELGDATTVPYSDAVAAAYRAYASAHNKVRWGDKTPRYIESIPFIARIFPTAKFVHLVRDGRNVALSYADVPFGPTTVVAAAKLWAERITKGVASGRDLRAGRYIEMRYEALTEDPEGEMAILCDFLGVAFEPTMLEGDRGEFVLGRAAAYNPHVTEKPTPGVRNWAADMTPRQVELFEAVAGDVLTLLGYERRYPAPGLRARSTATLGRLGLPVGRLHGGRK